MSKSDASTLEGGGLKSRSVIQRFLPFIRPHPMKRKFIWDTCKTCAASVPFAAQIAVNFDIDD